MWQQNKRLWLLILTVIVAGLITFAPRQGDSATTDLQLATEPFRDVVQGFEVGIIEGYETQVIAGVPVIEAPTGDIAYTVVSHRHLDTEVLSEEELTRLAATTFGRGEKFAIDMQAPNLAKKFPSGVTLAWTGTVTRQQQSQEIAGLLFASQVDDQVLLLLAAATEEKQEELPTVFNLLAKNLKPIF